MTTSKTKKAKPIVKQPKESKHGAKTRRRPNYKSFRLHKKIHRPGEELPSWWQLFKKSFLLMQANKKQIFVFFIVYGFLNLLLVRGFANSVDITEIQGSLRDIFDDQASALLVSLTSVGVLVDASTQSSGEGAQVYQSFLLVMASLAIIWLYRQQQSGNSVSMKDAFYRGMYPLIPFIMILVVMGFQLVPAIIGNFLLITVSDAGLIVGALEQTIWILLFLSTLLWSLYMISSSAIALYIVTLPDMTPLKALRQAKELVQYRRFSILLKTIVAALAGLVLMIAIVLPIVFIAPELAEWTFFSITVLGIPFIHGYMFSLYRELL